MRHLGVDVLPRSLSGGPCGPVLTRELATAQTENALVLQALHGCGENGLCVKCWRGWPCPPWLTADSRLADFRAVTVMYEPTEKLPQLAGTGSHSTYTWPTL